MAVAMDWFAVVVATRLNLQGSSGSNARGDVGYPKSELFWRADVQIKLFSDRGHLRDCFAG